MKRGIGRKSRIFHTLPAFDAPLGLWASHPNIAITFGTEKLDWWVYDKVEKFENMCTHFVTIYERADGRTDGHRTTAGRAANMV